MTSKESLGKKIGEGGGGESQRSLLRVLKIPPPRLPLPAHVSAIVVKTRSHTHFRGVFLGELSCFKDKEKSMADSLDVPSSWCRPLYAIFGIVE